MGLANFWATIRQAFAEFLAVPVSLIVGFVLLAIGSYALDSTDPAAIRPIHDFLKEHFLGHSDSTAALLSTVAGSVITVTSITFSLLLLAVQQSASSLSHQVIDQFLRRRINQVSFGFFVGVALFALITLGTTTSSFNPVYGAMLALILVAIALALLLVLLYTTIDQMRPAQIIAAIHDHTLAARREQMQLIDSTRRESNSLGAAGVEVCAQATGFMVAIDTRAIAAAIEGCNGEMEVQFDVSIGAYLGYHEVFAHVHAALPEDAEQLRKTVERSIRQQREREIQRDPGFGIEQLLDIGWTTGSTSKQNPAPAILAVLGLRDLLGRWSEKEERDWRGSARLAIVYPDNVPQTLLLAFESMAIVASESMQDQLFAVVIESLSMTFDRLTAEGRKTCEDIILRILSALGDLVPSTRLDTALSGLHAALMEAGRIEAAGSVAEAQSQLRLSIGHLNSRATRVPGA
jgi:uncharacterized membrane protein